MKDALVSHDTLPLHAALELLRIEGDVVGQGAKSC